MVKSLSWAVAVLTALTVPAALCMDCALVNVSGIPGAAPPSNLTEVLLIHAAPSDNASGSTHGVYWFQGCGDAPQQKTVSLLLATCPERAPLSSPGSSGAFTIFINASVGSIWLNCSDMNLTIVILDGATNNNITASNMHHPMSAKLIPPPPTSAVTPIASNRSLSVTIQLATNLSLTAASPPLLTCVGCTADQLPGVVTLEISNMLPLPAGQNDTTSAAPLMLSGTNLVASSPFMFPLMLDVENSSSSFQVHFVVRAGGGHSVTISLRNASIFLVTSGDRCDPFFLGTTIVGNGSSFSIFLTGEARLVTHILNKNTASRDRGGMQQNGTASLLLQGVSYLAAQHLGACALFADDVLFRTVSIDVRDCGYLAFSSEGSIFRSFQVNISAESHRSIESQDVFIHMERASMIHLHNLSSLAAGFREASSRDVHVAVVDCGHVNISGNSNIFVTFEKTTTNGNSSSPTSGGSSMVPFAARFYVGIILSNLHVDSVSRFVGVYRSPTLSANNPSNTSFALLVSRSTVVVSESSTLFTVGASFADWTVQLTNRSTLTFRSFGFLLTYLRDCRNGSILVGDGTEMYLYDKSVLVNGANASDIALSIVNGSRCTLRGLSILISSSVTSASSSSISDSVVVENISISVLLGSTLVLASQAFGVFVGPKLGHGQLRGFTFTMRSSNAGPLLLNISSHSSLVGFENASTVHGLSFVFDGAVGVAPIAPTGPAVVVLMSNTSFLVYHSFSDRIGTTRNAEVILVGAVVCNMSSLSTAFAALSQSLAECSIVLSQGAQLHLSSNANLFGCGAGSQLSFIVSGGSSMFTSRENGGLILSRESMEYIDFFVRDGAVVSIGAAFAGFISCSQIYHAVVSVTNGSQLSITSSTFFNVDSTATNVTLSASRGSWIVQSSIVLIAAYLVNTSIRATESSVLRVLWSAALLFAQHASHNLVMISGGSQLLLSSSAQVGQGYAFVDSQFSVNSGSVVSLSGGMLLQSLPPPTTGQISHITRLSLVIGGGSLVVCDARSQGMFAFGSGVNLSIAVAGRSQLNVGLNSVLMNVNALRNITITLNQSSVYIVSGSFLVNTSALSDLFLAALLQSSLYVNNGGYFLNIVGAAGGSVVSDIVVTQTLNSVFTLQGGSYFIVMDGNLSTVSNIAILLQGTSRLSLASSSVFLWVEGTTSQGAPGLALTVVRNTSIQVTAASSISTNLGYFIYLQRLHMDAFSLTVVSQSSIALRGYAMFIGFDDVVCRNVAVSFTESSTLLGVATGLLQVFGASADLTNISFHFGSYSVVQILNAFILAMTVGRLQHLSVVVSSARLQGLQRTSLFYFQTASDVAVNITSGSYVEAINESSVLVSVNSTVLAAVHLSTFSVLQLRNYSTMINAIGYAQALHFISEESSYVSVLTNASIFVMAVSNLTGCSIVLLASALTIADDSSFIVVENDKTEDAMHVQGIAVVLSDRQEVFVSNSSMFVFMRNRTPIAAACIQGVSLALLNGAKLMISQHAAWASVWVRATHITFLGWNFLSQGSSELFIEGSSALIDITTPFGRVDVANLDVELRETILTLRNQGSLILLNSTFALNVSTLRVSVLDATNVTLSGDSHLLTVGSSSRGGGRGEDEAFQEIHDVFQGMAIRLEGESNVTVVNSSVIRLGRGGASGGNVSVRQNAAHLELSRTSSFIHLTVTTTSLRFPFNLSIEQEEGSRGMVRIDTNSSYVIMVQDIPHEVPSLGAGEVDSVMLLLGLQNKTRIFFGSTSGVLNISRNSSLVRVISRAFDSNATECGVEIFSSFSGSRIDIANGSSLVEIAPLSNEAATTTHIHSVVSFVLSTIFMQQGSHIVSLLAGSARADAGSIAEVVMERTDCVFGTSPNAGSFVQLVEAASIGTRVEVRLAETNVLLKNVADRYTSQPWVVIGEPSGGITFSLDACVLRLPTLEFVAPSVSFALPRFFSTSGTAGAVQWSDVLVTQSQCAALRVQFANAFLPMYVHDWSMLRHIPTIPQNITAARATSCTEEMTFTHSETHQETQTAELSLTNSGSLSANATVSHLVTLSATRLTPSQTISDSDPLPVAAFVSLPRKGVGSIVVVAVGIAATTLSSAPGAGTSVVRAAFQRRAALVCAQFSMDAGLPSAMEDEEEDVNAGDLDDFLSIGGGPFVGGVVSSLILCSGCISAAAMGAIVLRTRRVSAETGHPPPWSDVLAELSMPGWFIAGPHAIAAPLLLANGPLVGHRGGATSILLCLVSVIMIAVPVAIAVDKLAFRFHARWKDAQLRRSAPLTTIAWFFATPNGEWVPPPCRPSRAMSSNPARNFVCHFGAMFDGCRFGCRAFFLLELSASLLAALVVVAATLSPETFCDATAGLLCAIQVALVVCLAALRPYSRRWEQVLATMLELCGAASATIDVVTAGEAQDTMNVLDMVQLCVGAALGISGVVDVVVRRRPSLLLLVLSALNVYNKIPRPSMNGPIGIDIWSVGNGSDQRRRRRTQPGGEMSASRSAPDGAVVTGAIEIVAQGDRRRQAQGEERRLASLRTLVELICRRD